MRNLLLSTAIGDISGKPYESRRTRTKDYDSVDLLLPENTYSDDTVCTFACADALLNHKDMAKTIKERCQADRHRGYGGRFRQWLDADGIQLSYHSFGNGSAMRVSAAGFMAKSEEECVQLAKETAMPTHDHPEGIKGAVATALAIHYCMNGHDKEYVRKHVLHKYYPDWSDKSYSEIKPDYHFDSSCQGSVPAALISFLESKDFVDCLKLAISLGGDSDTLAAIAAPIAYAHYRVIPKALLDNARKKLPQWMLELSEAFDTFILRIKST